MPRIALYSCPRSSRPKVYIMVMEVEKSGQTLTLDPKNAWAGDWAIPTKTNVFLTSLMCISSRLYRGI